LAFWLWVVYTHCLRFGLVGLHARLVYTLCVYTPLRLVGCAVHVVWLHAGFHSWCILHVAHVYRVGYPHVWLHTTGSGYTLRFYVGGSGLVRLHVLHVTVVGYVYVPRFVPHTRFAVWFTPTSHLRVYTPFTVTRSHFVTFAHGFVWFGLHTYVLRRCWCVSFGCYTHTHTVRFAHTFCTHGLRFAPHGLPHTHGFAVRTHTVHQHTFAHLLVHGLVGWRGLFTRYGCVTLAFCVGWLVGLRVYTRLVVGAPRFPHTHRPVTFTTVVWVVTVVVFVAAFTFLRLLHLVQFALLVVCLVTLVWFVYGRLPFGLVGYGCGLFRLVRLVTVWFVWFTLVWFGFVGCCVHVCVALVGFDVTRWFVTLPVGLLRWLVCVSCWFGLVGSFVLRCCYGCTLVYVGWLYFTFGWLHTRLDVCWLVWLVWLRLVGWVLVGFILFGWLVRSSGYTLLRWLVGLVVALVGWTRLFTFVGWLVYWFRFGLLVGLRWFTPWLVVTHVARLVLVWFVGYWLVGYVYVRFGWFPVVWLFV